MNQSRQKEICEAIIECIERDPLSRCVDFARVLGMRKSVLHYYVQTKEAALFAAWEYYRSAVDNGDRTRSPAFELGMYVHAFSSATLKTSIASLLTQHGPCEMKADLLLSVPRASRMAESVALPKGA